LRLLEFAPDDVVSLETPAFIVGPLVGLNYPIKIVLDVNGLDGTPHHGPFPEELDVDFHCPIRQALR